eukprot:jgi/Tetstr1/465964/TSEL_010556.t1
MALLHRLSAESGLPAGQVLAEALQLWADASGQNHGTGEVVVARLRPLPSPPCKQQALAGTSGVLDWAAHSEFMPGVFALLEDEAAELGKARLVCSSWAELALSSVRSLYPQPASGLAADEYVPRAVGLLRRCAGLTKLTINTRVDWWRDLTEQHMASILAEACAASQLQALHIYASFLVPAHLAAVRPLLPRLKTFSLASHSSQVSQEELKDALSSMTAVKNLEVSISSKPSDRADAQHGVPVPALSALPLCLTALRLELVAFGDLSLYCLRCLPSLTSLWMTRCEFDGLMGLSGASRLENLTLCTWTQTKKGDLEHILGLASLRHLRITDFDPTPNFLHRLRGSLPQLTSLSLQSWRTVSDDALRHLAALSGLTSLEVSTDDSGFNMELTGTGLRHLSGLVRLRTLSLENHTHPDFLRQGLPFLANLAALRSLSVARAELDSFHAANIPSQLQHLSLELCFGDGESEDMVQTLRAVVHRCQGLTSINLAFTDALTNAALVEVTRLPALQHILLDKDYIQHDLCDNDMGPLHEVASVLRALLKVRPFVMAHLPWYHSPLRSAGRLRAAAQALARECVSLQANTMPAQTR